MPAVSLQHGVGDWGVTQQHSCSEWVCHDALWVHVQDAAASMLGWQLCNFQSPMGPCWRDHHRQAVRAALAARLHDSITKQALV